MSLFFSVYCGSKGDRRRSWYVGTEGEVLAGGIGMGRGKSLDNFFNEDEDSDENDGRKGGPCRGNGRPTLYVLKQNLMRSPSDSSLMYINHLPSPAPLHPKQQPTTTGHSSVKAVPLVPCDTTPSPPELPPRLPAKASKENSTPATLPLPPPPMLEADFRSRH